MLEHGGRLRQAAREYGIPIDNWLDLSTGINPEPWPIPPVPVASWMRLPEEDDELTAAACACYGVPTLLPTAGTQAAIQALPRLRPAGRIAVLTPMYAEHALAWHRAGHQVIAATAGELEMLIEQVDVLVLTHPNNPDGARFTSTQLLDWQARLAARGGWLVVDEAFIDPTPQASLASHTEQPGLIVLRSLGKFFGLPGARVGFVCAQPALLAPLREQLGPWPIATPARWLATQALHDLAWQVSARLRLQGAAQRLARLLRDHALPVVGGCALFQWLPTPHAGELHAWLARQGILTRLFIHIPGLRLGLPGAEADWQRLQATLAALPAQYQRTDHGCHAVR